MKTVIIVQARMTSTRLPGKVLKALGGKPLLQNIYERLSRTKDADAVVIATSTEATDDLIAALCTAQGMKCYRGSLENVLDRYDRCAAACQADVVVRCTGDNPIIDPRIVDAAIEAFHRAKADYLLYKKGLPLGMAVEVFSFAALHRARQEAMNTECLEHVTPYILQNPDKFRVVRAEEAGDADRSAWRFTVDTMEDYTFVSKIYDAFPSNDFSYEDVTALLQHHPDWLRVNASVEQNKLHYHGEKML